MSYEMFISKAFNSRHRDLIATADAIMRQYARQGYDLSLRQLYYQFVAHHDLPNTVQNYKLLGGVISDARLAGELDWVYLVDRGRDTIENPHWDDPADFLDSVSRQYRFDLWKDQRYHIEVMVEKQALEGVLEPVCRRLDVAFSSNKGYSSSSHLYQVGQRIKGKLDEDKKIVILYLGDHDPSGIDMSRDVEQRLMMFSGFGDWDSDDRNVKDNESYDADAFQLVRVALNMPQIRQYNPPANPTKLDDPRAGSYLQRFGGECWELDALDPETLAGLVTDQVSNYTDDDLMTAQQIKWTDERNELIQMAASYRESHP